MLHGRRIALAPDIVVSAGAVIEGVLTIAAGTEDTTVAILEEARRSGRPPTAVAIEQARRLVAEGPPTESPAGS